MVADVGERSLVVHIGTHKTGTTSFQHALSSATDLLEASGRLRVFRSKYTPVRGWAHEVPLLVVRPGLSIMLRRVFPDASLESAQALIRQHVASQFSSAVNTILMSHEALSYLRTQQEFNDFKSLIAESGRTPRFVVVLREKGAFLRSYRAQLSKMGMPSRSQYRDSVSYTEPDSWLADTGSLIHGYHQAFGAASLTVLNYEVLLREDGSVVPGLWKACGLPTEALPDKVAWLNQS